MAGVGPPPKDPSKRARRNADVIPLRTVTVEPVQQPELPAFTVQVTIDGELQTQEFVWPTMTREWWAMLAKHPLSGEFVETDWAYLMDTALLHAKYWGGNLALASELRLREAKYGFTPEDRSRLRLQFAQATEAEVKTANAIVSSRERFSGMTVEDELEA